MTIPELREVLGQASPELQKPPITTMDQIVGDLYDGERLATHLLEIFGGLTLLLFLTGLYGLRDYAVTQRTHDLGVRVALVQGDGILFGLCCVKRGRCCCLVRWPAFLAWGL